MSIKQLIFKLMKLYSYVSVCNIEMNCLIGDGEIVWK